MTDGAIIKLLRNDPDFTESGQSAPVVKAKAEVKPAPHKPAAPSVQHPAPLHVEQPHVEPTHAATVTKAADPDRDPPAPTFDTEAKPKPDAK